MHSSDDDDDVDDDDDDDDKLPLSFHICQARVSGVCYNCCSFVQRAPDGANIAKLPKRGRR